MQTKFFSTAALSLLAATLVSGQTFTECDPTKKDCPPDPALAGTVDIDYTKGKNDFLKPLAGTTLTYDSSKGAVFSIENEKQAPTVASSQYIFFGKLEVDLQVAPGQGIVTSIVLQSDTLDEIDWEWLGGDNGKVQTNYFSKGDTSTYDRGGIHDVADVTGSYHTYTIDWTKEKLTWSVDGKVVRELKYEDAKGGAAYPQTPMQVKLGSWVAGSSTAPPGTVEWAGGLADFSSGPKHAYYHRVSVTDYQGGATGAKSYVYSDRTGTWQSIKIDTENGGISSNSTSSSDSSSTTASSTKTGGSVKPTSSSSDSEDSDDSTTAGPDSTTGSNADSTSSGAEATNSSVRDSGSIQTSFATSALVIAAIALFQTVL